ncbi:hypothetical protein SUGI_0303780 [Cryptomeria japonica]|uniref:protein BPS1, chloroplastic n=1 Tax=Cryptomeria japonica TaxID=3369 RepID=UPI002408D3D5|nr:protein BPS1, chloroplastic [Cryptomeria japonica]GLJ17448.1 hypothetical protein SUGI_0303780 [Cryptomeria japonica]
MGSLRGLQYALSFHSRSSPSTIYPTTDAHPERESQDTHLLADLQRLHEFGNYLSAGWLQKALEMCLSMHREVQQIFPQIRQAVQRQNSKWMDETLDDTVKLLDVCNALREYMRDIKQYQEKLHLVIHMLNGPIGPWQLGRARIALGSLCELPAKATEPPQNKSRLENCSSVLRRMGGKLAAPCAGGELVEPIHAAMDLTVFVCDLLLVALSFRSRRSLPLPCSGHSTWGGALQALQLKVKEEVDKRRNKGIVCVLLDELFAVESASQSVNDLLKRFLNSKSVPLKEAQDLELRQSVVCLKNCVAELEDGMAFIESQINELFEVIIGGRMALLDALTYS